MPNTYLQTIPSIRNLIIEKRFMDAYRSLRLYLDYPAKELQADEDLLSALDMFIQIAEGLGSTKLGPLAEDVKKDLNSVNALYEFAYQLYEEQVYGFAATILKRAALFVPQHERIITELVVNLENMGMNEEAVEVLKQCKELLELSFFANYLLTFNSILSGNIEQARSAFEKAKQLHDANSDDQKSMVNRLKLFLDRIDALDKVTRLDTSDLRLWHYIINGSIILYRSPHGIKEGMNGRFAFVQDSAAMIHTGMNLVQTALKELNITPENILYVNDPKSKTLATLMGKKMNLPVVKLDETNKDKKGLITVYDLKELDKEDYALIGQQREGQYIWAQASCWTEEDSYNPDFITFVYQQNISQWDEQLSYNKENKEERKAVFGNNMEANIKLIEAETLEDEKDQTEGLTRFTKKLNEAFAGKELFTYLHNIRQRKWRGSPVKSSFFV